MAIPVFGAREPALRSPLGWFCVPGRQVQKVCTVFGSRVRVDVGFVLCSRDSRVGELTTHTGARIGPQCNSSERKRLVACQSTTLL